MAFTGRVSIFRGTKTAINTALTALKAGATITSVSIKALAANYYIVSVGYDSSTAGGQTIAVYDGSLKQTQTAMNTQAGTAASEIFADLDCLVDGQPAIPIDSNPLSFAAGIICTL